MSSKNKRHSYTQTQKMHTTRLPPKATGSLLKLASQIVGIIFLLMIVEIHCDSVSDLANLNPDLLFTDPQILDTSSLYKSKLSATNRYQWLASSAQPKHHSSRLKRSATGGANFQHQQQAKFVDACQSKMEVLTPYYATNNKGKLRTVVNTELMQQAIQIETCARSTHQTAASSKCNSQPDCGCEQKYKWHRLLVMDPNETNGNGALSRGLFMDWFLFPSNCVCRCRTPPPSSSKSFLRMAYGSQQPKTG